MPRLKLFSILISILFTVYLVFALLFLLLCRNAAVHFNGIDPEADSSSLAGAYFTRLYFTTVAATTTGFGDISPKSPRARALTMLLLVLIVSYGLFMMINVAKLIRGRGA
ncbi:hypothetical protein TSOC_013025 [Tetrabaena socialis]|uniref:Potassium channel domain-containing protein n=1 Tax=Tetrabaena socialis TaxID=47790 RepID=A0A2J7ZLG0_9CHLO|nr:hypothetical protein TSOC_013025 [Tetrabaena socialis]|eukprot:PNH01108.1 hypothetical protein TSOC_013025 [Tetrabaena socialis]